jgi:hypothetical protein
VEAEFVHATGGRIHGTVYVSDFRNEPEDFSEVNGLANYMCLLFDEWIAEHSPQELGTALVLGHPPVLLYPSLLAVLWDGVRNGSPPP